MGKWRDDIESRLEDLSKIINGWDERKNEDGDTWTLKHRGLVEKVEGIELKLHELIDEVGVEHKAAILRSDGSENWWTVTPADASVKGRLGRIEEAVPERLTEDLEWLKEFADSIMADDDDAEQE